MDKRKKFLIFFFGILCFAFISSSFAKAANAQTPYVVFSDNFQDSDGINLNGHNPSWNCNVDDNVANSYNFIENNTLNLISGDYCSPPAVTNGSIEYVAINNGVEFSIRGLAIRYNDVYREFSWYTPTVDGYWHTIYSFNAIDNQEHAYKWEFSGQNLTLVVDGNQVYSAPVLPYLDGSYGVTLKLQDSLYGTPSTLKSFTVTNYDATPNTLIGISPKPTDLIYYPNPVTINLGHVNTPGINITNTYYILDGGTQQLYTNPLEVTGSGKHTITYWSENSESVVEDHKTHFFIIGGKPVSSSQIVFSDNFQGADGTSLNTHNSNWNCSTNNNYLQNNSLPMLISETCLPPSVTDGSIEYTALNYGPNFDIRGLSIRYNTIYKEFSWYTPTVDGYWHAIYSRDLVDNQEHNYKWVFNEAILSFYVDGNLVYSAPVLQYLREGRYTVNLATPDIFTGTPSVLSSFKVTSYDNLPPNVGVITAPIAPVAVNTQFNTSANFTDPNTYDTHAAVWNWGDNTTSPGAVTEASGSGSVGGSHTYTTPGVYTVTLTVTDNSGAASTSTYQYVVIYDPAGGFVTGAGRFNSPVGSISGSPTESGMTNFGTNAKYVNGVLTGSTRLNFRDGNYVFGFDSTSYDWLVVTNGNQAQLHGTGTVNGSGSYTFTLTALDNSPDTFRLQIWDGTTVIYDNNTSSLTNGNIEVHN